eukprot:TRINITY_DN732_c0_g1_i3.p1 TRINITY_DN732_c0_g1~~TRINITY_DN732_c0_g1_i3.p1  ORF type:complete len:540 (-),score=140.69 TRINITY_DN732_c0_g1_i3:27-1646(-)
MDPIARFKSSINPQNEAYIANYGEMTKLVNELEERMKLSLFQGREETIQKHIRKGKLTARERIEMVLDQDSPFLELMPLAGYGQKDSTVGGSSICGIGLVSGTECIISCNVPTLKGGALNHTSVLKGTRLAEIVFQNRLPVIAFVESGGADLTQQSKVFHDGGGSFRDLAMRSKSGIPTITVVFGSSTAGGAYAPGLSDYTVMVKNQAKVFLGGPPLVKMAIGEEVDEETLGGAEMHSKVSGVSDYLAENELDGIRIAREIIQNLHYQKRTPLPEAHFGLIEEPFYDPEELLGIVSANIRIPFDAKEVIARIVDGSRFSEFKSNYGTTLVTCFAKIHGIPVGILANNGVLFSESAQKGTQFIQLCNQSNTPLIFLQNVTGFMVGKRAEQNGIIKHGALLINAISNSEIPAITVMIGASYGAGNYGMSGRSYHPRFLFSWPNSKCSVMGPEQLSGVLDIVFRNRFGNNEIPAEIEQIAQDRKNKMTKQIEEESSAYYTTSRVIDDGIIDPRDTRNVLGICLSCIYSNTCLLYTSPSPRDA